jgi:hypothetical protein
MSRTGDWYLAELEKHGALPEEPDAHQVAWEAEMERRISEQEHQQLRERLRSFCRSEDGRKVEIALREHGLWQPEPYVESKETPF